MLPNPSIIGSDTSTLKYEKSARLTSSSLPGCHKFPLKNARKQVESDDWRSVARWIEWRWRGTPLSIAALLAESFEFLQHWWQRGDGV